MFGHFNLEIGDKNICVRQLNNDNAKVYMLYLYIYITGRAMRATAFCACSDNLFAIPDADTTYIHLHGRTSTYVNTFRARIDS